MTGNNAVGLKCFTLYELPPFQTVEHIKNRFRMFYFVIVQEKTNFVLTDGKFFKSI